MYDVSCGEMWSVLREGVRKNLGVYIQIHNVMGGRSLPLCCQGTAESIKYYLYVKHY